jgi:hypothetical protein
LGTAGFYCALGLTQSRRRKQKFFNSVEGLLQGAGNLDAGGWDAYFALGRFETDGSREATNVASMGSLYLDVDCGPTKDYPDQTEALRALRTFVKQTKLPKPIIVNSGRGLHVYWPLAASVPVAAWHPVALRLKAACVALGLRTDTTATSDAARVLRVPGTHNHKDDPPKPVAILAGGDEPLPLELIDGLLAPHAGKVAVPAKVGTMAGLFENAPMPVISAAVASAVSETMKALMGNFESSFKKIARKTIAGTGCAQIGQMLADPASVSEPLWRAGLSIAAHCKEKSAIHWVSQGHPEYDPKETEGKAALVKGPYLCASFDNINPGICAGCPLWGKIKSPISIGKLVAEIAPEVASEPVKLRDDTPTAAPKPGEIPLYPAPYFRLPSGGVGLKVKGEPGEEDDTRIVWHNDLYVVRRLTDPEMGEIVEMRHHLPRDGVRNFVVPLYAVTSKEEFRKTLAMQGVAAINKEVDTLMAYTQTWVKELQYTTVADNARRQFGWDKDFNGFVLGERLVTATGTEYNAPSTATRSMMDYFEPKGTLDGWKEAMNFYHRPGFELHQFVVCAGFGSVLMKFLPINAALIHLWSKDSGFGKTTALQAALSPWGDPSRLLIGERDTYYSKMNRADLLHSVPVCMDEITNIRPTDASDMIYQITGGQQRNRLTAAGNVERYRGEPWNLLFISTGNTSLIDKVSMAKTMPKAEAQRVLEIEVSKLFTAAEDKEVTDKFTRQLHEHHGHAGEIFVRYVMQNKDQVDILLTTMQRQIDRAANLGPENRFWSAVAAATISAAVICNHLGLLPYDVKGLRDYVLRKVLQVNQQASGAMTIDALPVVTDYVYQNWGRILQIQSTATGRNGHNNGLDLLVVPEQMPKGTEIIGRYETDKRRLYLLVKPLRTWLGEQQFNFASTIDELCTNHGAKRMNVKLTRGTAMNLPPAACIALDMDIGPEDGPETPA